LLLHSEEAVNKVAADTIASKSGEPFEIHEVYPDTPARQGITRKKQSCEWNIIEEPS
jgi:hypothetical protein